MTIYGNPSIADDRYDRRRENLRYCIDLLSYTDAFVKKADRHDDYKPNELVFHRDDKVDTGEVQTTAEELAGAPI